MTPDDGVQTLTRLTEAQKKGLAKLGIKTIRDLLYHFPTRYESSADMRKISDVKGSEDATLYGMFSKLEMKRSWKNKVPMAEGSFSDGSGTLRVMWFHQPYLAKMVPLNTLVRVSGKISERDGKKYLANPSVEPAAGIPFMENETGMFPVYPETAGITSLWIFHTVKRAIEKGFLDLLEDPLPPAILKKYNLPQLKSAMIFAHQPQKQKDADVAQKRFAFEEVFLIQVARGMEREKNKERKAYEIDVDEKKITAFIKSFPFEATKGQMKAIGAVVENFLEPYPMARLLEGDVGSGKTAIAAATAYAVAQSKPMHNHSLNHALGVVGRTSDTKSDVLAGNLQVAYMCPTEILAKQHFATFTSYFKKHPIQIALITSSGCFKFPSKVNPEKATPISRAQLLKWVANGEIPIVIGTHSLIQKTVVFKHLAYVIVDEQHRFGTAQRYALARGKTQIQNAQIEADKATSETNTDNLLYKDLSYAIRDAAYTVQNELGNGHKEIVYQNALEEELRKRAIPFSREHRIDVLYRKKKVGVYQPDFLIDGKIIVELKALPFTSQREKTQLWNYLKGSPYRLALLINFGTQKVEVTRVVYDTARNSRSSASGARLSAVSNPHLLSMTATPIPRTLALTLYGDLDLTILDELPAGRKSIMTDIIPPNKRDATYEKVRTLLKEGRQAYVICPRIDEPDPTKALALQTRSVLAEMKHLQKEVFPEYTLEKLHSKMTPKEKEDAMGRFERGEAHILVATSVVEVGVNVPNATVILIEGSDRFGLAQLHQLRGRVQRSAHQPYCFLMVEKSAGANNLRLKAIQSAKNGFELAEKDLSIRGAGELYGRRQWGLSDIGMSALKNLKLVEAARAEAITLVQKDSNLSKNTLLKERAEEKIASLHLE